MKLAALLALSAFGICAQSLVLTITPSQISAGGTAQLSVYFQDTAAGSNATALQWTVVLPTGITVGAPVLGQAGINTQKLLFQGTNPATLMFLGGFGTGQQNNSNALPTGVVATVPLVASSTAPVGTSQVSLTGLIAVDPSSAELTITNTPANVSVIRNKYDLNGDGVVDASDLSIAIGQVRGSAPCGNADVNGDGKCNVKDLQLIRNALNGLPVP